MVGRTKWQPKPIESGIFEILIKNRGEILTTDLFRQLKNEYKSITLSELHDMLFRLEVRSFIHLIDIKRGESKVEINRHAQFSHEYRKKVSTFMNLLS